MIRREFKAFTMAEVLTVLVVLGVLAAILIPAIATTRPDQNRVMFKKAYYLTERLISEIVNDEELYVYDPLRIGFLNSDKVVVIQANGTEKDYQVGFTTSAVGGTAGSTGAKQKLCLLFADRMNVTGTPDCSTGDRTLTSTPSFITTDGIAWYFPVSEFTVKGTSGAKSLYVDVNGTKKGPNCRCTATADVTSTSDPCKGICAKPDQFLIMIESDGKMSIKNSKEKEYLQEATTTR